MNEQITNLQRMAAARLDLQNLVGADHLTDGQAHAALTWWHSATGGLAFSAGHPGVLGVRAYHWVRARYGQDVRGIDGAAPVAHPAAAAMSQDLTLHRSWLATDNEDFAMAGLRRFVGGQKYEWVTELDVNGQFHAAAGIDLGTGEPEHIVGPRTLDAYLGMPGYLRLDHAPDRLPTHTWRALHNLGEGSVITTPQARYLARRGVTLDAAEVVVWPRHRRHLAAWYDTLRIARTRLAQQAMRGNMGATISLGLIKEVANTTLGGWMRSADFNHSDLLNRSWSDMIITEAGIRALISVDKAAEAGNPPIGQRRDALWFIGPHDFEPPGLTIDKTFHPTGRNGQLGKWKRTRSVPVTDELIGAWSTGSPEKMVQAMKRIWENADAR